MRPIGIFLRSVIGHVTALVMMLASFAWTSPAVAQDWSLQKTAQPTTYTSVGQTITYTYVLRNGGGGNGTLTVLLDDQIGVVNCPTNLVPVNAVITCTASYTITAADITNGSVTNVATATGNSCGECPIVVSSPPVTVNFVPPTTGSLTIAKQTANGTGTFAFSVTGPTAISGFSLTTTATGTPVSTAGSTLSNLSPGTYEFTENLPAGWSLTSVICTGAGLTSSNVEAGGTARITVAAGAGGTCTFTNSELGNRTRSIIGNFLTRRGDLLASETGRPRLVDRRANGTGGPFRNSSGAMMLGGGGNDEQGSFEFATSLSRIQSTSASRRKDSIARLGATSDHASLDIHDGGSTEPRPGFDVWVEGKYTYYDHGIDGQKSDGSFGLLRVGADYLLRPWLLVGVIAQFDKTSESSSALGYSIDGKGWMAGPFAEFQLSDNVILDIKGLWGESSNWISPFLTYRDTFETTRWLAAAYLLGWQEFPQVANRPAQSRKAEIDRVRLGDDPVLGWRKALHPAHDAGIGLSSRQRGGLGERSRCYAGRDNKPRRNRDDPRN